MPTAISIVQRFFPAVDEVKDAKKGVVIEVTKRDVNSSRVKDHKECAMAVACKRMMDLDGVIISRSTAYLVKDGKAIRYSVPMHVQKEIVAFDRGGIFEPGEYRLQRPHEAITLGVDREKPKSKQPVNKKRAEPRHVTANIRVGLQHG